ncbi:MAG: carboxymuconolactone decarboxylase family protein [Deltaproteobacteria bacterium]|nr:carboxymuconolactone decarboxylase family protein [Deltaproteobacteria bacterium]
MPKIPYARIEEKPQKIKDFYAKMEANSGRIGNLFLMVGHSTAVSREFIRYGDRLLFKSDLDDRFRELAIIRVSQICSSRYEWAHHVPIALRAGITIEQIEGMENWKASDLFSDEDKVILAFTEQVMKDSRPSEETFAAAASLLDPASLVELTLSIGHWSMVAKFLNTFQIEVEDDFFKANKDILPDKGPA